MFKRFLSLALLCCFTSVAMAQPVLTSATNSPVAGDSFYLYNCTGFATLSTGATGAGVTWDYSTAPAVVWDTLSYISSAGTPYTDSFPGCSLAEKSLVPGYGYSGYAYYSSDTSLFAYLGTFRPGSGTGYFRWDDPYAVFYYPLSYASTYLDSGVNNASGSRIVSNFSCDAYGSIKLPDGIHNNVLRVHKVNVIHYSPYYSVRNENYIWLEPGFHHELFWMNIDSTGGAHVSSAYYCVKAKPPTHLPGFEVAHVNIYPNPANNILHIDAAGPGAYSYLILDCLGRTAISEATAVGAATIDISTLPQGVYYIKLSGDNVSAVQTFVKM